MRPQSLTWFDSINLDNLIIQIKKGIDNKIKLTIKKLTIINYKKWGGNIIPIRRIKKSMLKIYYDSTVNIFQPNHKKKTHRDDSNATIKGCRVILEDVICVVRATTRKTNQTKYNEVNI